MDRWDDHTTAWNLRAAFDVVQGLEGRLDDVDAVARVALETAWGPLMGPAGPGLAFVRFADDGVSLWLADTVAGVPLEDAIRAIAGAFEPAAWAMAVVQPMRADGDPTIRGMNVRAALADAMVDVSVQVQDPHAAPEARTAGPAQLRRATLTDPSKGWLGVPPSVEITLPMLGGADA